MNSEEIIIENMSIRIFKLISVHFIENYFHTIVSVNFMIESASCEK